MIKRLYNNRFLYSRRIVQISVLLLLVSGNVLGWTILRGDLSFSEMFEIVPIADPFAVLQMFFAGSVIAVDLIIGSIIVLVLYGLVLGRTFCSWICPLNMITDLAAKLRTWIDKNKPGGKITISRNIRYWLIGLTLILSFVFNVAAFEMISPISILHRGIIYGFGLGWTLILAVFLFDLVAIKDGFCGHICPLGGFYSFISKYARLKVLHNHVACTSCMDCKIVCPEVPILKQIGKESGFILSGECTNCGRCIEVCPDDALRFKIR
ncbi:MAG: quinol dehydrogenase ferredoxin subunit NapH [Calditrichaeota bacterium]|nr:MAG: quinol dehydrogenase ferredoxin subunit NapH [Calditrichota bacterium]MBL1205090.1 quinol dehydrogenase ferredoxin subunit NapH [Calditrichota bacterium]NOG44920.1 quinol dehydrogenase ferredoxin subunit NapH [Calditrichota bacterium]